nr:hypothetical protein [Tanacetum cinerariifolium]
MAFISSSNTSSGKGEVPTSSVPTASIQVSTASIDVAAASLSHDIVCGGSLRGPWWRGMEIASHRVRSWFPGGGRQMSCRLVRDRHKLWDSLCSYLCTFTCLSLEKHSRSLECGRRPELFDQRVKDDGVLSKSIPDEVIEFGDSYQAPPEETCKGLAIESSAKKKGRTVDIITEDMQKRRNDGAILKTFDGNEATKKTKKNQLKQQYGNFKAEGSETLEQTFNRLQAIVNHLEFMDVEIEQDDLNQKFLTSLAPKWLMYIIVWRNRDDLDTMSLDDVYNHLKVGKGEVHTASVPTASTQVSTTSTDVAPASISHDTICTYIASQSNGSQIKYEDITQIDEDDIEKIDIKWNDSITTRWAILLGNAEYLEVKTEVREKVTDKEENHALVADEEAPTKFTLMEKSSLIYENKDIMMYPHPAQVYSPPKKDISLTGLPEYTDNTVIDYSRPTPSIDSSKSNTFLTHFSTDYSRPTPSIDSTVRLCSHCLTHFSTDNRAVGTVYALTINPTVYVSHIRKFWSTTRIETTNEETKILATVDDEPASLLRDDSQGEAFHTITSLDVGHDRENIIKTFALPYDSSSRVTSLDADEGNLEISGLKVRVKILKDNDRGREEPAQEDALIKGGSMEIREEVGVERSTELGSNDTEEMVNVLTSIKAANILTSRVAAVIVSSVAAATTVGVPTVSGLVPTGSVIFTTASVVKPYSRRPRKISTKDKGKEKVVESNLARDSEIARLHDEEELKMMIEGLDRSNEMIAMHLQEYEQAAANLSIGDKIELINELEQREFYMSVLRSHTGWKTRHFRGMTLEEIKEKFIPVWKQFEDFVPMSSKEEGERVKRKGLKLNQGSEKELWVELKRLFEPDFEDQLPTHTQNLMHDPLDWKLYDTCGVHHVSTKDQAIFMLVERDYPLRRGLTIVMICNKLQEVIEFGDSYQAPPEETGKGLVSESSAKKMGRTVVITTEDTKYETAQELWGAILKTFGGNKATKKTKKNQLKKQYSNFKAEVKQDDLNKKFLTSLAPEWLIGKGEVYTASVPTSSTQVLIASTDVAADSISHDTVCAYIASQSNGSQIKHEDITQINEDDIKEIDIKWNMALLSMRADRPTPSIDSSKSNISDLQNSNPSVSEPGESSNSIMSKGMIKFVKAADSPGVIKTNKTETARKSPIKYAEMYRNTSKSPIVRGKSAVRTQSRVLRVSTADLGNKGKAVKASAWIGGCSRYMTGNVSYLSEYEPYDGGYVLFGQGGGKITGKVVIDDFSRFTWTFFLRTMDETSGILRNFITEIENLKDLKVKIIRCDNGGEFKNIEINEFCTKKWIKREFSNARTPQQNGVAKRRNRTLPEQCTKDVASQGVKKDVSSLRYIALPNWFHEAHMESSNSDALDACNADVSESSGISNPTTTLKIPPAEQMESLTVESEFPTVSSPVLTVFLDTSPETSSGSRLISKGVNSQKETPSLDNALTLSNRFEDTIGVEADLSNMEHKSKEMEEHSFIAIIHQKTTPDLQQFCLFLCFLSQEEPKKIVDALKDPRIRHIGTKWVLKNKKDERGIVIRNKARLVAQGPTQEEVYQMDVKSAFLYGTIDEEAPRARYGTLSKYLLDNGFQRGTIDQTLFIRNHRGDFLLVQVYVDDIIFGSSNPQLYREFEALLHDKFQMSAMGELTLFFGLHVLQKKDGIFLSQEKYISDILKKFGYSDVRSSNTPMDKENPWGKDGLGKYVELHLYRSMIRSLMYLTASRPDIMFAVCACARHQVTPKECHLYAVKRIFRYLKGHPKLGLWYPNESPFDLVAYLDSNYGGATQDRKSTTGGCQFLGRRLISCQSKKQTIMATSITESEYITAASGCGQVL